ncbi:hypothetical protein [Leifsonia aquatica]|uniref:hypothetical protein n=1 Tax=Leifsonia aquatica TaxID=144185 RepID=UPI00381C4947
MDSGQATLLAAVLAAIVAAGVYLAGELTRLARDSRARRGAAVARVLDAVEAASHQSANGPVPPGTSLVYLSAVVRLMTVVRRKDLVLTDWLTWKGNILADAKGPGDVSAFVGSVNGGIIVWVRRPRHARVGFKRELEESGFFFEARSVLGRRSASRSSS